MLRSNTFWRNCLSRTTLICIKICNHYEVNVDRLTKDVSVALDRLKSGNSRTPGLSDRIPRWIQDAWLLASVDFGAARVRSGHLMLALMANESFARIAREISKEFDHISAESLQTKLAEITADSAEERDAVALGETAGVSDGAPVASGVPGKTKALDQYTEDLTGKGARRQDRSDPWPRFRDTADRGHSDATPSKQPYPYGRSGRWKDCRCRRLCASHRARAMFRSRLRNVSVRTLDLGLLQAGAGIKGEFENRLKSVIDEVKSSPQPIIMFIDEAHTMIGAGGAAGQNDAANLSETCPRARRAANDRRDYVGRI